MKRKKIIVGNWKMHLSVHESSLLVHRLNENIKIHRNIEVVLAPSMLSLQPISLQVDNRKFRLAAQNGYFVDEGAFTGEVSFAMLRNIVNYVIIGHSERRQYFKEDLPLIRDKVAAAVRNEITPILCIGETKIEYQSHETKRVIHDQLTTAISNLTTADVENLVIAYEPVWAISNGANYANHDIAKPDQVEAIVKYIREVIADLYGDRASKSVRIIYGGSTTADNAYSYLSVPGIDGLLPGGASLNYLEFSAIIAKAEQAEALSEKG